MTRIKNLPINQTHTVQVSDGTSTVSETVDNWQAPTPTSNVPRVNSSQHEGDLITMDTGIISPIDSYFWREVGGSNLATTQDFDSTGHAGKWVIPGVISSGQEALGPPIHVYMNMSMASHNEDDRRINAVIPHDLCTHRTIANGDWSDPAIWDTGKVPGNGSRVLIAHGHVVRYDLFSFYRLDQLRVDGEINFALDMSTRMVVETIICTRGSTFTIGTDNANRLPSQYDCEIIIGGRDYSQHDFFETNLNRVRDPFLWGRGFVSQGTVRIWGHRKKIGGLAASELQPGQNSIELAFDPDNWVPGDKVNISGVNAHTSYGNTSDNAGPMDTDDEELIIQSISGRTVTFTTNAQNEHRLLNTNIDREDIVPVVQLIEGRNITFRSESPEEHFRRGHFAIVHSMSTVDLWDFQLLDMSRTEKLFSTGRQTSETDFRVPDGLNNATDHTIPMTDESNVLGRYSLHLHHVGFGHSGARPIVNGVYVGRSNGWGFVHHACDVDFEECSGYEIFGCGMVAEQGNEIGNWLNCIMGKTSIELLGSNFAGSQTTFRFNVTPKLHMTLAGITGDTFRLGYGFGFRSRAIKCTGCIAYGFSTGFVFYPRTKSNPIVDILDHQRDNLDLGEVGLFRRGDVLTPGAFSPVDYPIIHFSDNYAVACNIGMFVTKAVHVQGHDTRIRLKRFTSWGHCEIGAMIEYVGYYSLEDFDIVPGLDRNGGAENAAEPGKFGIDIGNNAYEIAVVNCNTKGHRFSDIRASQLSVQGWENDFNTTNEPRHVFIGNVYDGWEDGVIPSYYNFVSGLTLDQVSVIDPDYDDTGVDRTVDPTHSFPLRLGTHDGAFAFTVPDNSMGRKTDTLSNDNPIALKQVNDGVFASNSVHLREVLNVTGYHQYNGDNVMVQNDIISDRITGRPAKYQWHWELTNTTGQNNNGALTYSTTPISQDDKEVVCPVGGSVVVDVVTGATGGGNIELDQAPSNYTRYGGDYIAPDHCFIDFDTSNGTITLTPISSTFEGTDECTVFLRREGQYATVNVRILVGTQGTIAAPVATIAPHADAATFGIALSKGGESAAGGRRVKTVQYSTDGGTTWRRFSCGWRPETHKITKQSDGTDLVDGQNYNVRLRYKTDWDFGTSAETADVQVAA